MKGRKSSRRHCSERGILLMEHAVSLPIFALLLTFLSFVLLWSWRSYQNEIADAELRQEMQIAAARIVESALLSDHIRERQHGVYEMRQDASRKKNESEKPLDKYWLADGQLLYNYASYPMTGAFSGAGVHISAFSVHPDPYAPRLYHIEMTGESMVTGRTYCIATAVYLREDMNER
jgi:hypothetical protein